MEHVEFARESEVFANELVSVGERKNWIVTIRFYSFLHYVEERLKSHDYASRHHRDRKDNILDCKYIDDKVRAIYRRLEDVSQMARYDCIRMNDEHVQKSGESLKEGKDILGFGDDGVTAKYST